MNTVLIHVYYLHSLHYNLVQMLS